MTIGHKDLLRLFGVCFQGIDNGSKTRVLADGIEPLAVQSAQLVVTRRHEQLMGILARFGIDELVREY